MPSVVTSSPYLDSSRPDMLAFVPLEAKCVLDVGCHTGHFGKAIKRKCGAVVWGVEPNAETAAVASMALDHVLNAFFTDDLGLPDGHFDVITFNDVLEHMADPWAALKLASKKLKPDGCVLISIPNLRHIENLLHIVFERDFRYEPEGIRDKTHLRFFTLKSAPKLFDGTGLTMVRLEGINEVWYTRSILRRLAYRLFPSYLEDTKYVQFAMVGKFA